MTPVVILKLSEDALAHGALGAARSLGRLGVPVHVLSQGDWRALERSRFVAGGRTLASDLADAEVAAAVAGYAHGLEREPILLCVGDVAAFFVEEHAEELAQCCRFPRQPPGLVARLADKRHLVGLCRELGLPTARTVSPGDLAEACAFASETGFPVMVKAADPRRIDWRTQVSVAKIADLDALLDCIRAPDSGVRPNVLLQEYVPGGSDSVWFFHGYFDERSACLAGFVGQKLREHPAGAGATTLGVCRRNDAVREMAVGLLQAVGYRGIVDAEFRFDAATGRYLVLDLNPRIGANFRLLVGANGMDVARALYLDLTGQPVAPANPPEGRKWWVESYDPTTWPAYFGRGGAPWWELVTSLRGVREAAWFAPDDLGPFLAMARRRAGDARRSLRSR